MKKILLTKGKFAIVDDEDFYYLSRFNWYCNINNQATRKIECCHKNKQNYEVRMSDFILNRSLGKQIAHKNRNNLDYRKKNLILVRWSHTRHNTYYSGCKNKTSKYRGVGYNSDMKTTPWRFQIQRKKNDEIIKLTEYFKTEKDAALMYNEKAKELYGEFAYQNKL